MVSYNFLYTLMITTTLLVSTCMSVASTEQQTDIGTSQDKADLYVFAYLWEPESCYKNPTWSQCSDPQSFWGNHFVIHGLWPQYSSGGYPSDCTSESFDETVINEIGLEDMNHYWPNVKSEPTDADYDSFWQHEWTKHGTCSPLSQLDYFNTTLILGKIFGTPSLITDNVGANVNGDLIRTTMGGPNMVSLQCENGGYLSGAFTCWSMSSVDGSPDKQIACPPDVQGEDNCSDTVIHIPSFE
jgi:ribonuclease I